MLYHASPRYLVVNEQLSYWRLHHNIMNMVVKFYFSLR